MADIIGAVTSLVGGAISWVTSFIGVITSNDLLLLFVITSFVGLGVGLLRRMIRL